MERKNKEKEKLIDRIKLFIPSPVCEKRLRNKEFIVPRAIRDLLG